METISKVRLAYFRDGKAIREIARKFNLARNTVKNIIRSGATDQKYERSEHLRPKLGIFVKQFINTDGINQQNKGTRQAMTNSIFGTWTFLRRAFSNGSGRSCDR